MPVPADVHERVRGAEVDRHVVHAERRREMASGVVATGSVSTKADGDKGARSCAARVKDQPLTGTVARYRSPGSLRGYCETVLADVERGA